MVHSYASDPGITPRYKYIDSEGKAQNFAGNTVYNCGDKPVILQIGTDVQADKDLNSAEISVKPAAATNYTSLNKWIYEPANTPGLVYTTTGRGRTIYRKDTDTEIANAIDEGVYPFINVVSLDFFKCKWNTREKASGTEPALVNNDAKWPDGMYDVKMDAMDIIGYPDAGAKKEEQKALDNFRPFLERAEIKNSNDDPKYLHTWNLNGSNLDKAGPASNVALGDGDYTIYFTFSEPIQNPTLSVDGPNGTAVPLTISANPAGNTKNFSASLSVGNNYPIADGLRTLTLKATDLAGNALLSLTSEKRIINPNSEITRNNFGILQGNGHGIEGGTITDGLGDRSADFLRNFLFSYVG